MQQTINIAIDGPTASGKTAVGKLLAEKLRYQFIDSGLFYRYLGYNYSKEPINNQIIFLKNLKNKLNKQQFLVEINSIEQLNDEDYLYSGKEVSKLAKNNKLHKEINLIIQEITKEKGYIVVGRDTTFNILPDANIKIF